MRFLEFLKEATAAKGKTPAEKKKEAQEVPTHCMGVKSFVQKILLKVKHRAG